MMITSSSITPETSTRSSEDLNTRATERIKRANAGVRFSVMSINLYP